MHAWSGHAGVDAVGYRLVHVFRQKVHDKLLNSLLNGCSNATTPLNLTRIYQTEGPIWRLVDEQPPHLLPAEFNSWQGLFLWAADEAIQGCTPEYIENCTWGQVNQVAIRHPLSGKLGLISPLLDAHNGPLPGGMFMPRIQRGKHGASQRFAVSPGRESEGYFHMPGGQSGHPLSPFYRAGHEAWVIGESTPFLPGKVQHRLLLASF